MQIARSFLATVLFNAALALTGVTALHADAFEGKVDYSVTDGKEKNAIKYAIKGDKLRLEVDATSKHGKDAMGSVIFDTKAEMMTILMPSESMYMEMSTKQMMQQARPGRPTDEKEAELKKTGKTEVICGYTCDEYLIESKGDTSSIYVTDKLGTFMFGSNPMGGQAPKNWERALGGKSLFPLKVVTRNKANKETFTMVATKVEKGNLPASLFEPPSGFTKFEMPSIPGMPGGFPMGGMGN
ncbi:MAG: DUF4412 domain-containing protein [Verrucomicrobiota bacterium]|nr:DUF4412 domain-containing protein [Verrucomicrobiota bacterium]